MAPLISPAELAEHRADAESEMVSRCRIGRETGRGTQDETDGRIPIEWTITYPDLPFRLAGRAKNSAPYRTRRPGDTELELAARVGHLPASTNDLADGDIIEITAGENAGTFWKIVDASWQDQATARRVPLIWIQKPIDWPGVV